MIAIELQGRKALITGGDSGLGAATAKSLAQAGADVAITYRYKADAAEQVAAVAKSFGVNAYTFELDNVSDKAQVDALFQRVDQQLGGLDILVNNAGTDGPRALCADSDIAAWRQVVETDLYGTFYTSQAAYPVMQRQGGGRIISISMTLHYRGWPLTPRATGARAGVDALTRTLALEWAGDHITVNAIAPGPIPTAGATNAFERPRLGPDPAGAAQPMNDAMLRQIPLQRWGTPEDVANMVVYLASPAGDWITGAIFVVDGGSWLAR